MIAIPRLLRAQAETPDRFLSRAASIHGQPHCPECGSSHLAVEPRGTGHKCRETATVDEWDVFVCRACGHEALDPDWKDAE